MRFQGPSALEWEKRATRSISGAAPLTKKDGIQPVDLPGKALLAGAGDSEVFTHGAEAQQAGGQPIAAGAVGIVQAVVGGAAAVIGSGEGGLQLVGAVVIPVGATVLVEVPGVDVSAFLVGQRKVRGDFDQPAQFREGPPGMAQFQLQSGPHLVGRQKGGIEPQGGGEVGQSAPVIA